jgi:23S rRNA pseudouridine2605 synthase
MERLQKVLAQAGIASRRAAEQIILAGRVRVDGRIVRELGTQVDPRTSRVEVDGTKIVAEKLVYIVLHKPRGVVCTLSDPEGRPTIRELLKDAGARVVPVGRLDFHTSGALLCTNDGEFAQGLAHPKKAVPKVYVAKVKGAVDDEALERFSQRIEIDGRPTQPAQVQRLRFEGDKTWLEITLREGRNRQVRRLGEATGFPVMRLARISHAGVTSEDLRPGQWRPLTVDELVEIKREYGVPKKVRAPHFDPAAGRDAGGKGTEGRPTRGDQRGAKRPKTGKERAALLAAERSDPFSRAARSVPKRTDERGGAPKRLEERGATPRRFEERGGAPKHGAERGATPRRFEDRGTTPRRHEGKAVEARRAESKRADEKRAEPKRFAGRAPKRLDDQRAEPKRFDAKRGAKAADAPRAKRDGRGSAPRRGTSR